MALVSSSRKVLLALFVFICLCQEISARKEVDHFGGNFIRQRRSIFGRSGFLFEKCDRRNKKMTVRGANVTLSKFLGEQNLLWCKHAQTLEILALEKLVIDSDLSAGNEGLSVIMIAKEWIVKGNRVIDLSGRNWESMKQAANGYRTDPDGWNGAPGNPGKNGGNFYGRYDRLTRVGPESSLTIYSNGGDGGNGQDGGNGLNGQSGENGKYEDFPSPYSELDSKMERLRHLELNIMYGYRYKNYIMHGTKGIPGGHGGDGGVGGFGGNPGFVNVTGANGQVSPFITVIKEKGSRGNDGKGGSGGQGGKHGDGYQCTWRGVLADSIRWWDKCHYVPVSKVASELFAESGRHGIDGGNDVGLKQPSQVDPKVDEIKSAEELYQRSLTAM